MLQGVFSLVTYFIFLKVLVAFIKVLDIYFISLKVLVMSDSLRPREL